MTPEQRNLEVRLMHARHEFITAFSNLQLIVHQAMREAGFWEDSEELMLMASLNSLQLEEANHRQLAIKTLGLVMTEPAEAIEAARKHNPETWGDVTKKDTLVRELAGTVVRCMDMAGHGNWRLGEAIVEEMLANLQRPRKHGGHA